MLEKKPPLATITNMAVLFFFSFFGSASFAMFTGIGLLQYMKWGMSLIDFVNASLIFLTVSVFTQAIIGVNGDIIVTKWGLRKP